MPEMNRRTLLSAAAAYLASAQAGQAGAQDPAAVRAQLMATLTRLSWDRRRAEQIWRQAGGPRFEIIDYVDMQFLGKVHRQPADRMDPAAEKAVRGEKLTYEALAEIQETLGAISAYFKSLRLAAPELPMANGKFYVFVCGDMGDIAGACGDARGKPELAAVDAAGTTVVPTATVPFGTHLMLSSLGYFAPYPDHPFSTKITVAHELLHAIDRHMVVSSEKPGVLDGVGNWWSEGNVDSAPQYALGALGYKPEDTLKAGARSHAKNIGARPFDYPLTLKGVPSYRPAWVREGLGAPSAPNTEANEANAFWTLNATYFTSCLWRFLMKEEAPVGPQGSPRTPGAFELLADLREVVITSSDVTAANQNSEWMDTGVPALDRFLREKHPTWGATGLHRAFPAFVAHFVEWPDQVIESRRGLLAHEKWIDALFMEGARKHDISVDKDISVELTVLPLAAKAIRFEIPQLGIGPDDYPPVTITVSIIDGNGQTNPIDNIHVGLRGQCLANQLSQNGRYGGGRVRRWASVKATPLRRSTVNDETVLSFINVATDPVTTKPVKIRVQVSLQAGSTSGRCSYHPKPVETEGGGTRPVPPSIAPGVDGGSVPILPTTITQEEIRLVIHKDADMVRMFNGALDVNTLNAVARESDDPPTQTLGMAASVMGAMTAAPGVGGGVPQGFDPAAMAALARPSAQRLSVTLAMPPVEPGFVGAIRGTSVIAEWFEPAYVSLSEYGIDANVQIETDAVRVQITSSGDGGVLGVFTADFDGGSQNVEAIFRGRIEGRFSCGIANDERAGDGGLPEDPSTSLPTDFWIAAGRAGMDTQALGNTLRQEAAAARAERGSSSGNGGGAGPGSGRSGSLGVQAPGTCRISQAEFEAWFRETYASQPIFQPSDLAELRRQFQENWSFTEQMLCDSRNAS